MTRNYRKERGRATEHLVAARWREDGWPWCEPTGAGAAGSDLKGTPGIAVEIKARTGFDPLAWMRQAARGSGLPVVIVRPNGAGEVTIDQWPALIPHGELRRLLRLAGYGDPVDT